MESSIVIKVKYGGTLRRFNARIDENERLELDMGALRAKILSLFNLAPDADLTLTYIDVDDDVVTLVDDDDLHDVMRQCLNPFRIDVLLNNDKGSRSCTRSSGNSTPMRSPRVQQPTPNINTGIAEILKSAPEPFREALSNLSVDLASKAASSAPLLAELVDCFSKMGQSYLSSGTLFQVGAESSTQNEASQSPMDPPVTESPKSLKDGMQEVFPNTTLSSQKVDIGHVTRGVATPITPAPAMDLNLDLPADSVPSGSTTVEVAPVASDVPAGNNRKETEKESYGHHGGIRVGFGAPKSSSIPIKHYFPGPLRTTDLGSGMSEQFSSNLWNSSTLNFGSNPLNECPYTGMTLADESVVPPAAYPRIHPFKRSYNHGDGLGGMFHKGVRCDGCGVHPITGPRFKSKVKEDYDLCNICFAEMGNEADYIRLDRPVSGRNPLPFKGLHDPMQHPRVLPHLLRGGGVKPGRPTKLNSHFILDVNIMDGTMMAPKTPFTKIWRMHNNGSFVWPRGTQLVWIGGDRFSDAVSVDLEIPADGVPMDKELDVAVDFKAPEQPGRYTSYWRMASPSGQKFGQRIWVLIQVDVSMNDLVSDSFQGLNLNLPPDSSGATKSPEIIDANVKPMVDGSTPEPLVRQVGFPFPVTPTVDEKPNNDQELNFPINDTLLVGNGVLKPFPPGVPSTVSYPIVDFSPVTSAAPPPPVKMPTSLEEVHGNNNVEQTLLRELEVHGNNNVEQTLLRELEEMGFKQVDLNKEILRMNEYNLEQSVDDLCGVGEWDPILDELQEMGFCDEEMNKRLLMKNNGSIKRVVMDLIAGEEA